MQLLTISNHNRKALVDDEDFERISRYTWNLGDSGIQAYFCGNCVKLARIILNAPKGLEVDHKNHNLFDNRKANLRLSTRSQNVANTRKSDSRGLTSRYKGVRFHANGWEANIRVNRMGIYLGRFSTEIEAADVYNKAAQEYFGEFACLNSVQV